MAEPDAKKKLRTSVDVYHRIMWDPELRGTHTWIIGYEDRFVGIMETSVEEFANSEIPWHRVQYFKRDNEIVWDRVARIDKIFG